MDKEIVILSFEIQKGQLVLLHLSNDEDVLVDKRTYTESPYTINSALTVDELSALLSLSVENRAKDRALWLLSRKDYSAAEMVKKLIPISNKDVAQKVVDRLTELNLISDERYAELLVREYCNFRKYPMQYAKRKMIEKGIPREIAENALLDAEVDDTSSAIAFLHKKCYNSSLEYRQKSKVIQQLMMKGFSYETIQQAMRIIDESEEVES